MSELENLKKITTEVIYDFANNDDKVYFDLSLILKDISLKSNLIICKRSKITFELNDFFDDYLIFLLDEYLNFVKNKYQNDSNIQICFNYSLLSDLYFYSNKEGSLKIIDFINQLTELNYKELEVDKKLAFKDIFSVMSFKMNGGDLDQEKINNLLIA